MESATPASSVVWVVPEGGSPSADAEDALVAWARARGVKLVAPSEPAVVPVEIDHSVAPRVEELLERARDAIVALDGEAASHALAQAEAEVRAHPELVQAAWLMAEIDRGWATRHTRIAPRDDARAVEEWALAAAIDGGRVAGVGEPDVSGAREKSATIVVPETESASIDGAPARGAVDVAPGDHVVVLTHEGRPILARWITLAAGETLPLPSPSAPPCSSPDLARAQLRGHDGARRDGDRFVTCPSWVLAVPAPGEHGIRVATCAASRCGPLSLWRGTGHALPPVPPPVEAARAWPTWATWAIAGAGAVVLTGAIVLGSGALSPSSRTETRFVNGGVRGASMVLPLRLF